MKRQLVITTYRNQLLTALYENDMLMELWFEPLGDHVRVGDIYIGKVKHIVPNIQAAFVEIQPGIMGYYSLKENTVHHFTNLKKNDKVIAGDELVVQVSKENLKTKAWSLTSRLSLPSRYIVLNADKENIQISSKIKSEPERSRLKAIVDSAMQAEKHIGFMVRTEAQGKAEEEIMSELSALQVDYNRIMSIADKRTCLSKLHGGDTIYLQLMKRYMSSSDLTITTDQYEIYHAMQVFLSRYPEESALNLKYYEDAGYPLIKLKGIEAQLDKALQKRVWMKSGGYLIIEPTEALTVIDVNTGKAIGHQNMEQHFFKINMEAAKEVCRQLRLRNISGIIVVDFINMKNEAHLQELMQYMRSEAANDSIQTTVVDRTALQLVEITRKKTRRSLAEQIRSLS